MEDNDHINELFQQFLEEQFPNIKNADNECDIFVINALKQAYLRGYKDSSVNHMYELTKALEKVDEKT